MVVVALAVAAAVVDVAGFECCFIAQPGVARATTSHSHADNLPFGYLPFFVNQLFHYELIYTMLHTYRSLNTF